MKKHISSIFDTESNREECINLMKEIEKQERLDITNRIKKILNKPEKIVYDYISELGFQEGAWYRPAHNNIVTAAMVSICNKENYSRDLVYAAQLHDAGNSLMKIAPTTKGADWQNTDKRLKHMEIGGIMTHAILGFLNSQSKKEVILNERIKKLKEIVEIHDNPYIGKKLPDDKETKALRCADRVFVPTTLSFYKDLIAYRSDNKYIKEAQKYGLDISPKNFLLFRLAFFYENESQLPTNWDKKQLPLSPEKVVFNESKKCEPPYTKTGKELIDYILTKRANELESILYVKTPGEFAQIFEESYVRETNSIISFAAKR